MGVPGFFASLYKKYKEFFFIFSKLDLKTFENLTYSTDISNVSELFLDTNCLIHPICFKTFFENENMAITNNDKLEEKMILAVIMYIEKIINLINPQTLVYIAIDGVAPMAKIKHQRMRRFKSISDNEMKEKIANKHNIQHVSQWNNSAITPGTVFMEKLTQAIINYLNIKKKNNKSENKIKYIFSTSNTPGEGEHKILQYIRDNKDSNVSRVIYGLDADLLYLSLASECNSIYLLREITEFHNINSDDGFCFVSIDVMKECIYKDMIESNNICIKDYVFNIDEYKNSIIRDYIVLGFFLGNDFLPNLPSVNLNSGKNLNGLEILLDYYKETFIDINKSNLIPVFLLSIEENKIIINYEFLKILFSYLSNDEEPFFKEKIKLRKYIQPCNDSDNPYKIELHLVENLMFKIPDLFELGKIHINESKKKYYDYYYKDENIDNIIRDYLIGLHWIAYYYFLKCPDWKWFFNHHRVPFVSDISNFINNNEQRVKQFVNIYPKIFDNYKLIKPLQQLFMVLPVQSAFLLPKSFKNVMLNELKEYYPKKINLDLQLINKYWQALPEIKILEPYLAWSKIKNIKLTAAEQDRNMFKQNYIIDV